MSNNKDIADRISSMNHDKYNVDVLNRYAESLSRKNSLIEQGLIKKRGYGLRSPEQRCELTEVLNINGRNIAIY